MGVAQIGPGLDRGGAQQSTRGVPENMVTIIVIMAGDLAVDVEGDDSGAVLGGLLLILHQHPAGVTRGRDVLCADVVNLVMRIIVMLIMMMMRMMILTWSTRCWILVLPPTLRDTLSGNSMAPASRDHMYRT